VEEEGRPVGFVISLDCRSQGAGVYVKRILIDEKDRGLGQAALGEFLERARLEYGPCDVWLNVRNENARAQAVYRKYGFTPFHPREEDAARYDAIAEAPPHLCFRMLRPASAAASGCGRRAR
jgi:ribosomal protein S18 acetylase RimI-like enzyme